MTPTPYSVSPHVRLTIDWREADVEALLHAHVERLGRQIVAQLVHEDEQRQPKDGHDQSPVAGDDQQRDRHEPAPGPHGDGLRRSSPAAARSFCDAA